MLTGSSAPVSVSRAPNYPGAVSDLAVHGSPPKVHTGDCTESTDTRVLGYSCAAMGILMSPSPPSRINNTSSSGLSPSHGSRRASHIPVDGSECTFG